MASPSYGQRTENSPNRKVAEYGQSIQSGDGATTTDVWTGSMLRHKGYAQETQPPSRSMQSLHDGPS